LVNGTFADPILPPLLELLRESIALDEAPEEGKQKFWISFYIVLILYLLQAGKCTLLEGKPSQLELLWTPIPLL
jgi:hypothetical protein